MKQNKGFTLVELLVAMAIIAVLIGLAGFGVTLALRASRDAQREETLDSVRVAIADYLATNNEYPATTAVSYANGNITVGSTDVPVDGHLVPDSSEPSDSGGTVYCYGKTGEGYALAVQLENGEYYELGSTDSDSCGTGTQKL
ncbi:prepilin-type N-terminal cleavage/methylation domain-containing protein [Candidatus Dojkabacteria bacterium]|nr:prepilin-type N-terminal cleavage/methylation domain-containing protein [Candidatus Dojkabacteria bacterium]